MIRQYLSIFVFTLFQSVLGNNFVYGNLKFKHKPLDILAVEDEDIMFSCKIVGHPVPVVTWSKRGDGVIPDRADISDSSLRINNVIMADEGEYVCHGTNMYGTVEASAKLIVQTIPIFIHEPANQTVVEGDNVTMKCSVSGIPEPTLFWAKEGSMDLLFIGHSSSNDGFKVDANGDLHIVKVQKSDEGFYSCSGLNSAGSSKSQAYLKVVGKDTILSNGKSNSYCSKQTLAMYLPLLIYSFK